MVLQATSFHFSLLFPAQKQVSCIPIKSMKNFTFFQEKENFRYMDRLFLLVKVLFFVLLLMVDVLYVT